IQYLNDLPLLVLLQHGPLEQPSILPIEALISPRSAQQVQIGATGRCGWPRRLERCARLNAAMAINTVDLNCVPGFSVKPAIAMIVLTEMAINAMHALFQMDVFQVDRFLEAIGIFGR